MVVKITLMFNRSRRLILISGNAPIATRLQHFVIRFPGAKEFARFIASGGIFPRTDIEWMSYLTTVRDLMRAGF